MASVLLALAALIGLISIKNLSSVNAKGGSMYADRVVPIRDLAEIRAILGDIDSQIQRAITDTSGDDSVYAETVAKDVKAADDLVKGYEATFLVAAEKDGLRAYHGEWRAYQKSFGALLEHTSQGDDRKAIAEYYARSASLYADVDGRVKHLITVNDKVAQELNAEIASTYSRGRTIPSCSSSSAWPPASRFAFALSRLDRPRRHRRPDPSASTRHRRDRRSRADLRHDGGQGPRERAQLRRHARPAQHAGRRDFAQLGHARPARPSRWPPRATKPAVPSARSPPR